MCIRKSFLKQCTTNEVNLKNINNFKDTESSYRRGRHLYDKKTANNRNRTVNGKGNAETV